jgi:hypothetical protein
MYGRGAKDKGNQMEHRQGVPFLTCLTASLQALAKIQPFLTVFPFQQGCLGIRLRASFTRPAIGSNALPSKVIAGFQARQQLLKELFSPLL